jgi:NAD(P)H-hydrate epimerase
MATTWPECAADARTLGEWAHALLIGPGLGRTSESLAVLEHLLRCFPGPVVLDADALSLFEGQSRQLAALLDGRPAVLTPHEMEFSRLSGMSLASVAAGRFEVAGELARALSCTVLLKGVPTVVSDGTVVQVSAAGTPVLATAGSGDVLGGIVATLLAQTAHARESAAAGAWVHGRAAELAGAGRVRGVTLDDVVAAIRGAWVGEPRASGQPAAITPSPWLAELRAAGERA